MTTDRDAILRGAKEVFFKAMLAGYAGNGERSIITKTPDGYTTIEFSEGDYRVVDRYCTTPHSDKSAGTITIFYGGIPVWWMSFCGFYRKEAIPFLKKALSVTYEAGYFNGGRGPQVLHNEKFFYSNIRGEALNFEKFNGREEIYDHETDKLLGFHEYLGTSLI